MTKAQNIREKRTWQQTDMSAKGGMSTTQITSSTRQMKTIDHTISVEIRTTILAVRGLSSYNFPKLKIPDSEILSHDQTITLIEHFLWTYSKCYTFDQISKKGYCSHIPLCASPGRRPATTSRPYWVSSSAATTTTTKMTRPSRRPTSSWKCGAPVVKDQDILASVTNLGIFFQCWLGKNKLSDNRRWYPGSLRRSKRIHGGTNAQAGAFPWIVSLKGPSWTFYIFENFVLYTFIRMISNRKLRWNYFGTSSNCNSGPLRRKSNKTDNKCLRWCVFNQ